MDSVADETHTADAVRWDARPRAAFATKAMALLAPIAASVAATIGVSKIVSRPTELVALLAWWVGLMAMASLVAVVVERLARRLLPLASLLSLSIAFPDEAPSRFDAALRNRTVADLEAALENARLTGGEVDDAEAAERLLELLIGLNTHDRRTRGHADRVRAYTEMIAVELGLPEPVRERLRWAAMLHDIGKLEVPAELLNLPRRPTALERQGLERHTVEGEALTRSLKGWLGEPLRAVAEHHERWDGQGYPRRLAGEQISLAGRIVAVADAYDAMTGPKTYQERVSAVEARAELTRGAGSQFDPTVVRAFLNVSLGRLRLVMGPLTWLSNSPVLARVPVAAGVATAVSALAVAAGLVAASSPAERLPDATEVAAEAPADRIEFVPADADRGPVTTVPQAPPTTRPSTGGGPTTTSTVPPDDGPPAPPPGQEPPPEEDPPPDPPTERPRSVTPDLAFSIAEDTSVTATLAPDDETAAVDQPTHGTVTRVAGNRFVYRPPSDWNGTARFGYHRCRDGCSAATITVRVQAVNDRPALHAGPDQTTLEDGGGHTVPGWADLDPGPADERGQRLTVDTVVDDPGFFAVTPTVSGTGTLRYTPAADANGTTTIRVTATDDGGTADGGDDTSHTRAAVITLTPVNDAPRISGGADLAIAEDAAPQSVTGWMAVDPGPADEAGQVTEADVSTDDPTLFAAGPTLGPDGTLTYTPAPDAVGTATLRVLAADDGGSAHGGDDTANASAILTVEAVADAPVTVDDTAEVDEDASGVTFDVLANDTDADADALVLWDYDDTTLDGGSLTASGSSLTYVPDPDVNGTDTFDYWVTDGSGGFDRGSVTITVRPVPDAPRAVDDGFATPEGAALVVPDPGLMGNDSDVDGDTLTVAPTPVVPPTDGGLVLLPGGGFTYTPDAGFTGEEVFVYRIDDGTGRSAVATVSIIVEDARVNQGWYLGAAGVGPDDWFLVDDPLPPSDPVADHDGDGHPGLTVVQSDGGSGEDDGRRFQNWQLAPTTPLELSGPVSLELSAAIKDFRNERRPITTFVRLQDCRDDGTGCRPLLTAEIDVADWSRGTDDFVRHDLNLGSVATTIVPGRMLRMRLMFGHRDMWVATTDAQRSRLVLTVIDVPPVP